MTHDTQITVTLNKVYKEPLKLTGTRLVVFTAVGDLLNQVGAYAGDPTLVVLTWPVGCPRPLLALPLAGPDWSANDLAAWLGLTTDERLSAGFPA